MSRSEQAYYARWDGEDWDHIAERLDFASTASAYVSAREWAERRGMERPPGYERRTRRQAEAYTLRASGHTWREVAERLDYSTDVAALVAARTHAQREGLDWPVPTDGGAS